MGSCTSKGAPNTRHNSRNVSKVDFQQQETEFPLQNFGQEKSSHNTTAQRILPHLPSDDHSSYRVNFPQRAAAKAINSYTPGNGNSTPTKINEEVELENNEILLDTNQEDKKNELDFNFNPKMKSDCKDQQFCTQNTHTDCDVQFTSFEIQPKNIPKGSFVGANNLSDAAYHNSHRESQKQAVLGSFQSKKILKDHFLQSRSDKKSLIGNKKNSVYSITSIQFSTDLEEKKLSLSCIPLIKAFHSPTFNTNNNNSSNNNKSIQIFSVPTSPQIRKNCSVFDNLVARATGKSLEFVDEQAFNFVCQNNFQQDNQQQCHLNIIRGNTQLKILSKDNSFSQANDQSQIQEMQIDQNEMPDVPLSGKRMTQANHNFSTRKPGLKINTAEEGGGRTSGILIPISNKINDCTLTQKDRIYLLKYAKNWQQLGRSYSQRSQWNETLSCLLIPCQLYISINQIDHLVAVLAEAYMSFMLLLCSQNKNDTQDEDLKKAELKFNFIRNQIASSPLSSGIIPKLNLFQNQKQPSTQFQTGLQQQQLPQQEPSQKNTEKNFLFDEWMSNTSTFASEKERASNELILFLDMLLMVLRPQLSVQRNLSFGLQSLLEVFKPCDVHSPFIHSMNSDLKALSQTLSSGYNEVAFENRETNALLELHHMGGIESSEGQKLKGIERSIRRLISEFGQELLLRFAEEVSKGGNDYVSLKINSVSESLIKIGHLLRLWLDYPQIALFFYEQALGEDQTNSQVLYFCGLSLRDVKKTPEAIQYFNQALQINHYYSECYLNLGSIYLQEYTNIQVAERFFVKALISSSYTACSSPSSYSSSSTNQVSKGRIFNLLGETHKQNVLSINQYFYFQQELGLASVFFASGVQKDCLYEENYYDIIEAISSGDADSKDIKDYFKIIIDLVSFSLFEKQNWKQELQNYQIRLRHILKKQKRSQPFFSNLMNLFEQSSESEDGYLTFIEAFKIGLEESQNFIRKVLERTITQNIKEIGELFAVRSLHEESSQEDMPYITIVRDTLNEFSLD